jgi:hypothetical protein
MYDDVTHTDDKRYDHYANHTPFFLYAEGNNLLKVLSFMEVDQVR